MGCHQADVAEQTARRAVWTTDVGVGISLAMTIVFLAACLAIVGWIFRTGYRLKN